MVYSRLKCHLCSDPIDFGQEVRFINHLTSIHLIVDSQREYDRVHHDSIRPTCQCDPTCSAEVMWGGWKKGYVSKYVRGHNAKVDSVYLDSARQSEFAAKRKHGYESGKYKVWNDGLTKNSSPKIESMSFKIGATLREGHDSGRIINWRDIDSKKALSAAKKMSRTKKEQFANGSCVSWNKGKTKVDTPAIEAAAIKISQKYIQREMGRRLTVTEFEERVARALGDMFTSLHDSSKHYRPKHDAFGVVCVVCNLSSFKTLYMLETCCKCFHCHPRESHAQLEIFEYIKSITPDAILSDRILISPKEVDILVPSSKLAIEYSGLYWHSSLFRDRQYHQEKRQSVISKGYSFIEIYEDEWRDKKEIIKSMLSHRLGSFKEKRDARKFDVVELSRLERKKFFERYHLEGDSRAEISFGFKDGDVVIAAISLRRPFHKKWVDYYELARSACASEFNIRGWLGKLSKHASNYALLNEKQLMTYVDNRVGTGNSYQLAGWNISKLDTGPRFWWTNFGLRYNRFKFKSQGNKSQAQIAKEANVIPIYGCSNSIFVYER